ncbi:hypothetical protein HCJ76_43970 [Streptomyces sp. MC1]|uniref:hypothetical protein n=1 Tax=Streptomyces sp. MC1 TaxID=295105 RepID=UPI0018CB680E|nr:hypothetical protein [Streptomyces sp. MC1]MBG7704841.1 hypothetical protein [Streptomyces sp. MC1]
MSSRTRVLPLTMRLHLVAWVGRHRLRAKVIRAQVAGRNRVIGYAASVLGYTLALGVCPYPCGTTRGRYKDFGSDRIGLYTIGGWRTRRPVPVSTGWVRGGDNSRIGITVTVASRTLMLAQLATPAEVRASRERFGDLHRKAPR